MPESDVPESDVPESDVPESDVPESDVPEPDVDDVTSPSELVDEPVFPEVSSAPVDDSSPGRGGNVVLAAVGSG